MNDNNKIGNNKTVAHYADGVGVSDNNHRNNNNENIAKWKTLKSIAQKLRQELLTIVKRNWMFMYVCVCVPICVC